MEAIRKQKRRTLARKENMTAWLLLSPMVVYYTIFSIVPVIFVVVVSFFDWNIFYGEMEWNNFNNFVRIFSDPSYFNSFINSAIMGLSILVLNMGIGLLIALGLSKNIYARGFQRVMWYIPVVISMAVISDILGKMLLPTANGTINIMLSKFGIETVAWNQSTFWMFFWIIILCVWKGLGTTILYFIAGLNAIPKNLYEAADIDGCNKRQRFMYITIPGLRPMTSFILITSLIGIFNIFEPVQLISGGDPMGTTEVVMFKIYQEMVGNAEMGMSSAISLLVTIFVFIISIFSLKTTKLKME
ncbi:MAG: carbohydrate ABC transporter permease [Christensenellales bacterium]